MDLIITVPKNEYQGSACKKDGSQVYKSTTGLFEAKQKGGPSILSPNIKLKEITDCLNSDLGRLYRTLPFTLLHLET